MNKIGEDIADKFHQYIADNLNKPVKKIFRPTIIEGFNKVKTLHVDKCEETSSMTSDSALSEDIRAPKVLLEVEGIGGNTKGMIMGTISEHSRARSSKSKSGSGKSGSASSRRSKYSSKRS